MLVHPSDQGRGPVLFVEVIFNSLQHVLIGDGVYLFYPLFKVIDVAAVDEFLAV